MGLRLAYKHPILKIRWSPNNANKLPNTNCLRFSFCYTFCVLVVEKQNLKKVNFQNTQFFLSKVAGKEGYHMILIIHSVFLQLLFNYWQKAF